MAACHISNFEATRRFVESPCFGRTTRAAGTRICSTDRKVRYGRGTGRHTHPSRRPARIPGGTLEWHDFPGSWYQIGATLDLDRVTGGCMVRFRGSLVRMVPFWAAIAVATPALAEEDGAADAGNPPPENALAAAGDTDAPPMIVVTGRGENLMRTALSASQGAIGAADFQDMPLLRRGELLETVPGMVVTQHSGDGKANQYFLRGFNLDHGTDFAFSVDGVPLNLPSHAHGQGYTDLNFTIPELISSIAYKKGPFYAEVGDFSGSGAADLKIVN